MIPSRAQGEYSSERVRTNDFHHSMLVAATYLDAAVSINKLQNRVPMANFALGTPLHRLTSPGALWALSAFQAAVVLRAEEVALADA